MCSENPAEETARIARICNNDMDLLTFPHRSIQQLFYGGISVLYKNRRVF